MHKYYDVYSSDNPRFAIVTDPNDEDTEHWTHRAKYIKRPKPIVLTIKKRGKLTDALGTDLLVFLASERLREVVDAHKSPKDVVQWIPARVIDGKQRVPYYVLHFPERPPVLHLERTLWSEPGHFIKPVLDWELVKDRCVFALSPDSDLWIAFRDDLLAAIRAAGCTGLGYHPLPVA